MVTLERSSRAALPRYVVFTGALLPLPSCGEMRVGRASSTATVIVDVRVNSWAVVVVVAVDALLVCYGQGQELGHGMSVGVGID